MCREPILKLISKIENTQINLTLHSDSFRFSFRFVIVVPENHSDSDSDSVYKINLTTNPRFELRSELSFVPIRSLISTFSFVLIFVLLRFRSHSKCVSVGIQEIAWAFGGMIFALVYCTAGISGGHINPAVTFGLFLARKLSLTRAVFYIIMQCIGAICGAGVVKGFEGNARYELFKGGANVVNPGYTKGDGLGAEIVGTFVLVYTVFSATDAKRNARDSHVPILAPLPIGFAVFLVHLATIPITGTGINPAWKLIRCLRSIKEHAFVASEYPIVITLEDHLTPDLQAKVAEHCVWMKELMSLLNSVGLERLLQNVLQEQWVVPLLSESGSES
ncbi:hypothetical protein P8452_57566 [Trifolium repens]|nr:hypothetical protein P8452_57566 [Trifolium repens]